MNLQKVYTRRTITPNQTGRKSPLRVEVPIEEFDLEIPNENEFNTEDLFDQLDQCDKEIMMILSNTFSKYSSSTSSTSDEEDSEEEMYHYERCKCPALESNLFDF